MTEDEFFRIPNFKVFYAPKVDRYFIRSKSERDGITWLSDKQNLGYGGIGDSGWKLGKKPTARRHRITNRNFKFGWDDSLYNGRPGHGLENTLDGYRLNRENELKIPVSFLTATN